MSCGSTKELFQSFSLRKTAIHYNICERSYLEKRQEAIIKLIGGAVTDTGNIKTVNQDSVCLKIAQTEQYGQVAMAVLCDGMGGLDKGELASAEIIRVCENWFHNVLPGEIGRVSLQQISQELDHMVKAQNSRILNYGKSVKFNLGTTLSLLLIMEGEYLILHVGDSRIYEIGERLRQLTEDQTFVVREIKCGRMTPEEAATDRRRNVLLQCVGASKSVAPDILFGKVQEDTVFMLCSDGFRHVLTGQEIYENLSPDVISGEGDIVRNCGYLVDLVKERRERDNISVILLKSVG